MVGTEEVARLEVDTLYTVALNFLREADDCLHKEPLSQVHQHLQRAGFKKLPQLYKSAYRDFKVVNALQELHMPVSISDKEELIGASYAGCTENYGGATEERFVGANAPGLGSRQEWHAELIPEIEDQLTEHCKWLAEILEHSEELDTLADAASQEMGAVEATQQRNISLVLELAEDLRCYLTLLSEFLDQQMAFIKTSILTGQKELDLKESSFLQASCKAQILKVKVIEQRLLSFTYTEQTVPALKAVADHLCTAEEQAELTFQQLNGRLKQYEDAGPEFASLANRYQQLLEDLRHAEYTLDEFQQAAAASAESP